MNQNDALTRETFLRLKAKVAQGHSWTPEESAGLQRSLEDHGDIGILAGCCMIVCNPSEPNHRAIEVIRPAFARDNPRYVEMSIYEALIYAQPEALVPIRDEVFSMIERSLMQRAINLDNTIFLLGKMARMGENRALEFLRTLARDDDTEIQSSAIRVLRGIESV